MLLFVFTLGPSAALIMKEEKIATKTIFVFLKTLIAILLQPILDLIKAFPLLRAGI